MVVHLAGNDVRIESRIIQRCLVCGYKLVDVDLTKVAEPIDFGKVPENWPRYPVFSVGHLIEVNEHGGMTEYLDKGDTKQPQFDAKWDDCCVQLVEG